MREQALAVQRMQDYLEAHPEREITLSDLAGVSLGSSGNTPGSRPPITSGGCGCPSLPCG